MTQHPTRQYDDYPTYLSYGQIIICPYNATTWRHIEGEKQDCGTGVSPVLTKWAGYTCDTAAESLCRGEPGAIGNFIRRSLTKPYEGG